MIRNEERTYAEAIAVTVGESADDGDVRRGAMSITGTSSVVDLLRKRRPPPRCSNLVKRIIEVKPCHINDYQNVWTRSVDKTFRPSLS